MSAMRSASRGGGSSRRNRSDQDGEERGILSASGSNPNYDEVDMELMDPNKKLIEPDHGHNFKPNPTEVVHKIVKCMTSKYDQAWTSWKKVPKDVRDMWFGEFQKVYQWHPQHFLQIRKNFETRGGIRLKNLFNKVREADKCPDWIPEGVWKELQDQWKSNDFKVKSERAKKNRASDVDGLGTSLHTGGSIPTTEHKRRLENKAGKEVSDVDLFLGTHQKKDSTWIDNRSAQTYEKWSKTWEEMEKAQDTNDSSYQSVKLSQDQLWASSNAMKKGSIYGLGAEGGKYKNSTHSYSVSSSHMEEQLDKEKLVEEIEALKKENLEQKEERKQMSEQLQEMMNILNDLKEKKKKKKKKRAS